MDDQRTLSAPTSRLRRWLPALLPWGVLALLAAALLWHIRAQASRVNPEPPASSHPPPTLTEAEVGALEPPTVQPPAVEAHAFEGPTEPAGYDPSRHPHPITAQHLRLYRENDLLEGAWQALRKRDVAAARQLVVTHRSEYPGSKEHMEEGLLLLADCIERPSAETKALAQTFYDTKTHSPMRRRLRRLCLELPD